MAATAHAHLQLVPYEADTVPIDPEDLRMYVRLLDPDGIVRWHRKMAETAGLLTACDDPREIDYDLVLEQRVEKYEGEMCRGGCFSKSELERAKQANARR